MRVAILSDIHANRHAFEAVLDDAETRGAEEMWCLGDLVGYGAEPNECVQMARDHAAICLCGNHDLGVTGGITLDEFSRGAGIAACWTQEVLSPENAKFLQELSPSGTDSGVGLYHASPRDPVWEYVISDLLAELCLSTAEHRISLVGHSHVALSFARPEGETASGEPRRHGEELDLSEGMWLMNPGSVGQPRDGDPRAAWLMLDVEALTATWYRVDYDIVGAAAAIRAARLPDSLADRLGYGQ